MLHMAFIHSTFELEYDYSNTPAGGQCDSCRLIALTAPPLLPLPSKFTPNPTTGGETVPVNLALPAHQHNGTFNNRHQYAGALHGTARCWRERSLGGGEVASWWCV